MPCPFTGPKKFWARPNFLYQSKKLFTYKIFVPDKKMICIQENWFLCRHKSFWRGTKCSQILGLAQKIWTGSKHFGTCKRTRHNSTWNSWSVLCALNLLSTFWQKLVIFGKVPSITPSQLKQSKVHCSDVTD